jgi:hypothetical protein
LPLPFLQSDISNLKFEISAAVAFASAFARSRRGAACCARLCNTCEVVAYRPRVTSLKVFRDPSVNFAEEIRS